MRSIIASVFFLFAATFASHSQTIVPDTIFTSTTWTPAGNPYIISDTTVVLNVATLTIDPGVIVKFNSAATLHVRGKLHAIGNVTDSIEFTSNLPSPTMGCWAGIKAVWTTSPSITGNQVTMEYVKGKYADRFVDMNQAYDGPYIFRHCYFAYNTKVNHDGGMPSVRWEYCKFQYNNTGLDYCQFNNRVSHSLFVNNVDGAIGIGRIDTCTFMYNTGRAISPYGSTVGCTIKYNHIGVNCMFNGVNDTFINNVVSENISGVEIQTYFNGSITFTGNQICNNTLWNVQMIAPFATNDADLSLNCFCSFDSVFVQSTIYDKNNNNALGTVSFLPFDAACSDTLSVNAHDLEKFKVSVFPNPFTNYLTIQVANNVDNMSVILFDITGRKMMERKFVNIVVLETGTLANGSYTYILENEKGETLAGKLIKN